MIPAKKLAREAKDTPDQVKAVIAYDKARKGTDDATYDSEHGDKKQAKKERDYAKWQRDKGAEMLRSQVILGNMLRDLLERKKVRRVKKHAHVKDSYDPLHCQSYRQGLSDAYRAVYDEDKLSMVMIRKVQSLNPADVEERKK